jgi:hypothetical protein
MTRDRFMELRRCLHITNPATYEHIQKGDPGYDKLRQVRWFVDVIRNACMKDKVVTSDVFRENHVRRTSPGRVRTSLRPDERPSRPTAGGRPLADGPSGRPPGGWPRRTPSPAAERTATLQKNSQEHHNIL